MSVKVELVKTPTLIRYVKGCNNKKLKPTEKAPSGQRWNNESKKINFLLDLDLEVKKQENKSGHIKLCPKHLSKFEDLVNFIQ